MLSPLAANIALAAGAGTSTVLAFHDRTWKVALMAALLLVSVGLAARLALTIEQVLALPLLAIIAYTDLRFRRVELAVVVALALLAVICAAFGGIVGAGWLLAGCVATLSLWLMQRQAPIADLVAVGATITMLHDIGVFVFAATIFTMIVISYPKRTYSRRLQAVQRAAFIPLAGFVGVFSLAVLTVASLILPSWAPIVDAHRLLVFR